MASTELIPGSILDEQIEILTQVEERGPLRQLLARHLEQRRDLVLHVVETGSQANLRDRVLKELEHASAIEHPGLPQRLACQIHGKAVYLPEVSPHGETLKSRLEATPQGLPPRRVAQHLRTLLEILEVAHDHGCFHGRLRPEVIVLVPNEQGEGLRLTELGVVQALNAARKINPLKFKLDRPPLAPPEEGNGRKPPSTTTDLFAAGLLARHMLTGEPVERLSSRKLPESIPEGFRTLLQQALNRDPLKRFPHATAFREALDALVSQLPEAPRTETTAARFEMPERSPGTSLLEQRFGEELALLKEIERDFTHEPEPSTALDPLAADSITSLVDDSLNLSSGGRIGRHSMLASLDMEMAELEKERQIDSEDTQVYQREPPSSTVITAKPNKESTSVTQRPMMMLAEAQRARDANTSERKESTLLARRPLAAPETPDADLTDTDGTAALRVEGGLEDGFESTSLARNPFLELGTTSDDALAPPPSSEESTPEDAPVPAPDSKASENLLSSELFLDVEEADALAAARSSHPEPQLITEDEWFADKDTEAAARKSGLLPPVDATPASRQAPARSSATPMLLMLAAVVLAVIAIVLWSGSDSSEESDAEAAPAPPIEAPVHKQNKSIAVEPALPIDTTFPRYGALEGASTGLAVGAFPPAPKEVPPTRPSTSSNTARTPPSTRKSSSTRKTSSSTTSTSSSTKKETTPETPRETPPDFLKMKVD